MTQSIPPTLSGAIFSDCKQYRYALWRRWKIPGKYVLFIMLNPSRGNEFYNDQTITRLTTFTRHWGYDGLFVGNLFALRSPYPQRVFQDTEAATGLFNDLWLEEMAKRSVRTVFAWGAWPDCIDRRARQIITRFGINAWTFGLTKQLHPKHPVRLNGSTELIPFQKP